MPDGYSLMQGGPVFRLERRLRLDWTTGELGKPTRRFLLAALIGWVPLALLEVWEGLPLRAFGRDATTFLLALPALFAAMPYTDGRIAAAVRQLRGALTEPDLPRFDQALRYSRRFRDSVTVELLLGVTAWAVAASLRPLIAPETTARGLWRDWVSVPLLVFFLLRWTGRFILWCALLARASRLRLTVTPTHADRAGGLALLSNAQASFWPLVFALGCVGVGTGETGTQAARWATTFHYAGSQAVYAFVACAGIFAPLALFSPALLKAKQACDESLSALVTRHSRQFERKWFDVSAQTPMLGEPDFSSQADLGTAFEVARKMRWFPFSVRPTAGLLAAALAPLLPGLIARHELVTALLQLVGRAR